MKVKIPNLLRAFGLKIRKHSPEILMVSGAVSIVGGVVMACKATLKAQDALNDLDATIDSVESQIDEGSVTEEDGVEVIKKAKLSTCLEVSKPYIPAVGLIAGGLGLMFGGHHITQKRYAGLTVSYAALQSSFEAYRKRVEEKLGEDAEREIRYNASKENMTVIDLNEDGTSKKTKAKNITSEGLAGYSMYARIFDESCGAWDDGVGHNLAFLKAAERYFNDILVSRSAATGTGVVFLNEVYDYLGIPRTDFGQVAGWVYRRNEEKQIGAGYVSFGIYSNLDKERVRAFINGYEKNILLDFNVVDNVIAYV